MDDASTPLGSTATPGSVPQSDIMPPPSDLPSGLFNTPVSPPAPPETSQMGSTPPPSAADTGWMNSSPFATVVPAGGSAAPPEPTPPVEPLSSPPVESVAPPEMPVSVAESTVVSVPGPEVVSPADAGTPPTPSGEETFVIPPSGGASGNPFIPSTPPPGQQPPSSSAKPGNPLMKRLLMVVVFLVILGGLALGGKFVLGLVGGAKEVTLTYWGLWENDPTMQSVIADFQTQNPKVKVQYVKQSARQYRERLQAAIARGEGPDIFQFHNTWVPMLRNELLAAPAKLMTTTDFSSEFYPVAAADLVGGENIYGLPIMYDGLGLYYNEDLFASAGVTPPTTWPELLDIVPKLTVKTDTAIEKSAIALGTTGNVENFSDIVGLMLLQNGAKLVNPTGKEAEDTLTFYHKFATPSDPVYTWNETMDNSIPAFANGKVAMIIAPSWRAFDIKQINPSLRFKIVPVPQLPGNTINWASYWVDGVSAKSKSPEQAWAFVRYITGKDAVSRLYSEAAKTRLFGPPYARLDLASTITDDPFVGAYIQEAPTAKSFPLASRTFDNGLNDKLIKYLEDAVNAVGAGTSPTEALSTAATGFQQVLSSFGLASEAAPTSP